MIFSSRIIQLAQMVTPCGTVADIGCDHCLTLIYLVQNARCKRGIGCDLNAGPLSRAQEYLDTLSMSDKIELRLGDGFSPLSVGEADTAVISGMGGQLINKILNKNTALTASFKELVLSPHLDVPAVRRNLHLLGYQIADEQVMVQDGIYYSILRAVPGIEAAYSDIQYQYGRIPIAEKNPFLKDWLGITLDKNQKIIVSLTKNNTENAKKRYATILEENNKIEEVLKCL